MKFKCISVFVSILFLMCCSNPEPKQTKKEIKINQLEMTAWKDYEEIDYLAGIYGMSFKNEFLYLSDSTNHRVIKLDLALNVVDQFGGQGEGPGEFNGAGQSCIAQDRLIVESMFARRLGVFDLEGTFLDWVPLSEYTIRTHFVAYDHLIFLSSSKKEKNISVINFDGEFEYGFGTSRFTDDRREMQARNNKHLGIVEVDEQPYLLALSDSEPLLELFTLEGNLVFSQDLTKYPYVAPALERGIKGRKENPQQRNVTYIIFDNMFIDGNRLYTFVWSLKPPFRILRFDIEKAVARFVEVFEIQENFAPDKFVVHQDQFLTYDHRGRYMIAYKVN